VWVVLQKFLSKANADLVLFISLELTHNSEDTFNLRTVDQLFLLESYLLFKLETQL